MERLFCAQADFYRVWSCWSIGGSRRSLPDAWERLFVDARFFIPGRRLSRPTFKRFVEAFNETGDIKRSIDDLIGNIPSDDFAVALSSAYEWIYAAVKALRFNAGALAIEISEVTSVAGLRAVSRSALTELFSPRYAWRPFHHMVLHPP